MHLLLSIDLQKVKHTDRNLDISSNRSEIEGRSQLQIQLRQMMLPKVAFVQMIGMGIIREVVRRRNQEAKTQDGSLAFPGTR
jgi:hypothetical protein